MTEVIIITYEVLDLNWEGAQMHESNIEEKEEQRNEEPADPLILMIENYDQEEYIGFETI